MDELVDLGELTRLATGDDARVACAAVDKLGESGATDATTIQLLIDLMTTRDRYFVVANRGWGNEYQHVWESAARAIKQLGQVAVDALSERIVAPRSPADDVLLERSAEIGPPLFDLARVLVTDGDARRARAAEPIVAASAHLLEVDEAIGIYLTVCDRERYAARPMPPLLRAMWRRFATAELRAAIAARWTDRELRTWIEGRLDRDPLQACALCALLIAGPADALPILRRALLVFGDSARFTACESMLTIDPLRSGDVLHGDPVLWAWAEARAQLSARQELDLRLMIACSRSSDVLTSYAGSWEFQNHPDELVDILQTMDDAQARAWCDQLVRAAPQDPRIRGSVQLVIDALKR